MLKNQNIKLISYLAKIDYRKEIIKKLNNLEERIKKIEDKEKKGYCENLKTYFEEDRKKKIEIIKELNS